MTRILMKLFVSQIFQKSNNSSVGLSQKSYLVGPSQSSGLSQSKSHNSPPETRSLNKVDILLTFNTTKLCRRAVPLALLDQRRCNILKESAAQQVLSLIHHSLIYSVYPRSAITQLASYFGLFSPSESWNLDILHDFTRTREPYSFTIWILTVSCIKCS